MDKKAQAFVQDLVIAILIISMISIVYFNFYTNQNISGEYVHQDLLSEAKTISDYLMGAGYPLSWNESNIVRLGITNGDNVLNATKASLFSNMTDNQTGYDKSRSLLKTKYHYIVFFRDYNGNVLNITEKNFLGKPGVNSTNIDDEAPAYLAKISRFVVLKEGTINVTARIVEMMIYVWSIQK
ncbi:hypothetical protein GOV08_04525 [Candidatus Woesearchaeota archaeon]|nr:hypothetical protein [Candidatus Woesearchaeota archaeon]